MSRMFKALQQVGATPDSEHQPRPLSQAELEAFGLWHLLDTPEVEGAAFAETTLESAISLLSESEPATEMDASDVHPAAADGSPYAEAGFEPAAPDAGRPGGESAKEEDFKCSETHDGPVEDGTPTDSPPGFLDSEPVWPVRREYGELADRILLRVPPGQSTALTFVAIGCQGATAETLLHLAVALKERVPGEVLLVDAHFDLPLLTEWFGLDSEQTVVDVLFDRAPWSDVVRRTEVPGLSVLPGGRLQPADQTLLNCRHFGGLLDRLREHYELVLVHSNCETALAALGRESDGVYVVVQLERTLRRAARKVIARFKKERSPLLGCIATVAGP